MKLLKKTNATKKLNLSGLTQLSRTELKQVIGGTSSPGECTTSTCSLGCQKDGYCSSCCQA